MIFHFVVHRLRWLAGVPLAPQFFDACLLMWTAFFHRKTLAAMEELEARMVKLPGVGLRPHRFGGTGFTRAGVEFAHLHSNGLLDVHLDRGRADSVVAAGRALPHHVFGRSSWVSFWVQGASDLSAAMELLKLGQS